MGHIWSLVFSASVGLGILHKGLGGLSKLDGLSKRTSRLWSEEYRLRHCIFREAAKKNLHMAYLVLAKEFPDRRPRLEEEWKILGDDLVRMYPEDLDPTLVGEETCCSSEEPVCFSLFLEFHSGQETPWPNFVPRLSHHSPEADL